MVSVILLMAGSGSRMKSDVNKVLLPLNSKPIFMYPLELFLKYNFEVICVISKNDEDIVKEYLKDKNVKLTYGGKTRGESVYNGLLECSGDYVLVHDSARALLSSDVIDTILKEKNDNEAILVCHKVKDTIKEISKDSKLKTLNRELLIGAETPQCASRKILLSSYEQGINDNLIFTDDISLIERYYPNIKIKTILGNEENFKITTPIDYKLAKMIVGDFNV